MSITNFFYWIFTLQHIDHTRSSYWNKKNFFNLFFQVYSPARYATAVTKSCSGKKCSYYLYYLSYCSYISEKPLQIFHKMNTLTSIYKWFYLDFKQFSLVFNILRKFSNGEFRKFLWHTEPFSDILEVWTGRFSLGRSMKWQTFYYVSKMCSTSSCLAMRGVSRSPGVIYDGDLFSDS